MFEYICSWLFLTSWQPKVEVDEVEVDEKEFSGQLAGR
jgi:hypothetical protein